MALIRPPFRLVHAQARQRAAAFCAEAPDGTEVRFSEPTRSGDQNAKFHSQCGDIAKSGLTWMGKTRTAAQWKVLLVSGHAVATKEESEVVRGLEGEWLNIRESTALMSVRRASSLIEYVDAFCAQNGIKKNEEMY